MIVVRLLVKKGRDGFKSLVRFKHCFQTVKLEVSELFAVSLNKHSTRQFQILAKE